MDELLTEGNFCGVSSRPHELAIVQGYSQRMGYVCIEDRMIDS
jgi:hypothetical protein